MLEVRFVVPDLRRIEQLKSEALCVGMFADERPPRGALGLVDWRLCGWVSRLMQSGRLSGAVGETLMLPPRPRLPFDRLLVFGLGPRDEFDAGRFEDVTERLLRTLDRAAVRASVCDLPGRRILPVETAMSVFLRVASRHGEQDEMTLIEDPEAQKAIESIVERERRRMRSLLG